TRLRLVSVAAGRDPTFAASGLDASAIASANTAGRLTITTAQSSGSMPAGLVSVATLTMSGIKGGPASFNSDPSATSLASGIQVSGAMLFGPSPIAPI